MSNEVNQALAYDHYLNIREALHNAYYGSAKNNLQLSLEEIAEGIAGEFNNQQLAELIASLEAVQDRAITLKVKEQGPMMRMIDSLIGRK